LTFVAIDFSSEIKDLRATMTSVREVTDLDALAAKITDLKPPPPCVVVELFDPAPWYTETDTTSWPP